MYSFQKHYANLKILTEKVEKSTKALLQTMSIISAVIWEEHDKTKGERRAVMERLEEIERSVQECKLELGRDASGKLAAEVEESDA